MGWSEAELSLTLLNDRTMARLNRDTFGRRGPTNVIAFPLDAASSTTEPGPMQTNSGPSPAGPRPLLGEVVISLDTTRRQAQECGWPWRELLDFYLIHGILHLIGHDHDTPAAETAMNTQAWELMSVLYPGRRWEDEF